MQLLDLDHLRSFLAIVNAGSFTKAALHVNKTQSAVSVQVRRLEETVGCALFEKSGRQSKLTREGERLVEYARKLLDLNNEAVGQLSSPRLSGHIRIGTPVYAERYFPVIFRGFAQSYLDVDIEIISHESHKLAQEVDSGELDLALVTHPSTHQRGEVIRMEQLYWVTSPRHHVHELEVVPLAIYHATSALRRIATEALDKSGRHYRIAYSSSSHDALVGAVTAGLAVGFLPGCSLQPNLRIISEREGFPPLPQFGIALIEGAGADEPHIKAMCRHIKRSLSNLMMAEP